MEIVNGKLGKDQIYSLILISDISFIPEPLSKRVDLKAYAIKLADKATHFYAMEGEELIGMNCCYMNDSDNKKAFISLICIRPDFIGKGIGTILTNECEKYAVLKGFAFIECEVHSENLPSLEMYKKMGYVIDRKMDDHHYIMRKKIQINTDKENTDKHR